MLGKILILNLIFFASLVESFINWEDFGGIQDLINNSEIPEDIVIPQTYQLINKNGQILAGNRCISISVSDISNEISSDDLDSISLSKNVYALSLEECMNPDESSIDFRAQTWTFNNGVICSNFNVNLNKEYCWRGNSQPVKLTKIVYRLVILI